MSPAKFIRQVKNEVAKITWISKKEVVLSTVMILFVVFFASLFFMLVDWLSYSFIQALLGLGEVL